MTAINNAAKQGNWYGISPQTFEDAGFGVIDDQTYAISSFALKDAYQIKQADLSFGEIESILEDAKDVSAEIDVVNAAFPSVNILSDSAVGTVIPSPISSDNTVKISWDKAYYATYIDVTNGVATISGTLISNPQEALFLKFEKGTVSYSYVMKMVVITD